MHSSPYKSFDLMIALNTLIFHLIDVLAFFQKYLKSIAIRYTISQSVSYFRLVVECVCE